MTHKIKTIKKKEPNKYLKELDAGDLELINEMELFGMTQTEAIVYIYLLKYGREASVSQISSGTYIHRQYVYITLDKLISNNLIIIIDGVKNKYKASPPAVLESLARKKVDKAIDLGQSLYKISKLDNEQDFEIFIGDKQVKDFENSLIKNLKVGESQYIISGASKNFLNYFGEQYKSNTRIAKNKKLTSYYVGSTEEEGSLLEAKRQNPLFKYKLVKGIPTGVTSTVVRSDTVTIYSLAKPALVYVIKSKVVSEEYKKYFDVLWSMGK